MYEQEDTRQHVADLPPEVELTRRARREYIAADPTRQHDYPQEQVFDAPAARRRGKKSNTMRGLIVGAVAGLIAIVLLSVLTVAGAYGYFQAQGLIVPGVSVGGVDVSGLTVDEAAQRLNQAWNYDGRFVVAVEDQEWPAKPADFGIRLDALATAQRAGNVAHGGSPITEAFDMLDALVNGWPVNPVVTIDTDQARGALVEWSATINRAPQDATLKIENGQIVAVPGVQGWTLDVEATLAALQVDPGAALREGYLPMVLIPIAPAVEDASAALEQARTLVAQPLSITVYDAITDQSFQYTAQPEQIAAWLSVSNEGEGPQITVSEERVTGYLNEIDSSLGDGRSIDPVKNAPVLSEALKSQTPAILIVSHLPTSYTVEYGDSLTLIGWKVGMPYWRILEANPGLEANGLDVGQTLNIPSKDDLLPLPIVPGKRILLSISEQHMWLYENGAQVNEFVISTGIDRSPTQPGVFQVQTHEINAYASLWDLYMPHFLGIYESWPGFMNGFHGLPLLSGGTRLWGDILGSPASYGCIILDLDDGETLYNWAEDGVVVEIRE